MPPRRRSPGTRRPRVAGTQNRRPPAADRASNGLQAGGVSLDTVDAPDALDPVAEVLPDASEEPADGPAEPTVADLTELAEPSKSAPQGRRVRLARQLKPATAPAPAANLAPETEPDAAPEPKPKRTRTAADANTVERRRGRALVALAVIGVLCAGLAVWFAVATNQLRSTASASNEALVDVGTTSQVKGQVEDALKKVYSYDFTRLDENERTARTVITGDFGPKFDQLFKSVREIAPAQQAVVTATVAVAAVKVLDGDRAIVLVYLDQQATRGVDPKQLVAAARLTVTAQRVDGQWKIADVDSR